MRRRKGGRDIVNKQRSERATLSQIEAVLKQPTTDVNAVDEQGCTALHHAVGNLYANGTKRIDVVKMLLQYGANPHAVTSSDCLSVFYCCKSIEVMELLIMCGVDVDVVGRLGPVVIEHGTALHKNLRFTFSERILLLETRLLIAAGADANFVDEYGESSLCRALNARKWRTVRTLIAGGATIDQRAHDIFALHYMAVPNKNTIKVEQNIIESVRIRLVMPRVFEICVGLHEMQLCVLEMCLVLEYAVPVFCLMASHVQWRIVQFIRHSTSQSIAERTAQSAAIDAAKKKRKGPSEKQMKRMRL